MKMEMVPDRWLASILGCRAFKVVVALDSDLQQTDQDLRQLEPGFYYAKLPVFDLMS